MTKICQLYLDKKGLILFIINRMSRQSWSLQEDEAIYKLVGQYGSYDWTMIASKLKDHLGIKKRTGKQCRQRWYNHLNPAVNKQPWTQKQQQMLFVYHKKHGNRWKDISSLFIGRTDNDIKNHFYSTLRRSLRRLNKIIGEKNSTTQMRQIKPSVLSTIMNCIYQNQIVQNELVQSLKDLPILIFEFAKFKPIKINIKETNIQTIKLKTSEIFNLIAKFNQQYEQNKAFRRNLKHEKFHRKTSTFEQIYVKYEMQSFMKNQQQKNEQQKNSQVHALGNNQKQQKSFSTQHNDLAKGFLQNIEEHQYNNNKAEDGNSNIKADSLQQCHQIDPIYSKFCASPQSNLRENHNMSIYHQLFSLQDDMNVMHFNEIDQPSKALHQGMDNFNIHVHDKQIKCDSSKIHGEQLLNQVISMNFYTRQINQS